MYLIKAIMMYRLFVLGKYIVKKFRLELSGPKVKNTIHVMVHVFYHIAYGYIHPNHTNLQCMPVNHAWWSGKKCCYCIIVNGTMSFLFDLSFK